MMFRSDHLEFAGVLMLLFVLHALHLPLVR